ncbi:hypothetical protein DFH06DRAFT_1374170 [Mycena polygramma]|nr:hypothetical protein DFH06DRAFT_1374170 [Mycena polygramma]
MIGKMCVTWQRHQLVGRSSSSPLPTTFSLAFSVSPAHHRSPKSTPSPIDLVKTSHWLNNSNSLKTLCHQDSPGLPAAKSQHRQALSPQEFLRDLKNPSLWFPAPALASKLGSSTLPRFTFYVDTALRRVWFATHNPSLLASRCIALRFGARRHGRGLTAVKVEGIFFEGIFRRLQDHLSQSSDVFPKTPKDAERQKGLWGDFGPDFVKDAHLSKIYVFGIFDVFAKTPKMPKMNLTMATDPNRRHTRAATLAGIYPAPTLPRNTPSSSSSPPSPSLSRATGSLNTRPVTPELLYSTVASAVSLSRGVSPAALEGQGDVPGDASVSALSELPSLTRDVDFGSVRSPSPMSTVVHGETMSVRSNDIDRRATPLPPPPSEQSESVSTVSKATQDLSRDELVSLARRYESMARDAIAEANRKLSAPFDAEPNSGSADPSLREFSSAVPVDGGPSRNKGKGPDPRNWGAAGFSVDFSDNDLEAQREAFDNFAEINRKVKQEEPMWNRR